jgi:HK97 family phage major capsid protein
LSPPADDFEECITQATLNGNRLRFTREVARDENAASVLETVYNPYPTLHQDGTKPEGSFTLATVTVNDSKIAEFVTASDEVLEDCSFVASLIDQFLIDDINKEKRRQLINGTGLNGQMLGILNQPDLLVRTHQDVGDGGAVDDNYYDTFRRGLTDLWLQSASTDNVCIIMHPRDGEAIDLTKDEFGRYLFNDSDCFNRMLRCLKIRYSVDVPQGTAIMGNFSNNWVFFLRKALEIRMGYTGDQFITNTNTILGEMRGLAIVRCPRKILKISGLGGVVESS